MSDCKCKSCGKYGGMIKDVISGKLQPSHLHTIADDDMVRSVSHVVSGIAKSIPKEVINSRALKTKLRRLSSKSTKLSNKRKILNSSHAKKFFATLGGFSSNAGASPVGGKAIDEAHQIQINQRTPKSYGQPRGWGINDVNEGKESSDGPPSYLSQPIANDNNTRAMGGGGLKEDLRKRFKKFI